MPEARFFSEHLSAVVQLDEFESRHCVKSRRLSVGDAVVLFDGHGHEAGGVIQAAERGGIRVALGEIISRPRPLPVLTLAVALPKGPRQEVLVEKCTELGVAALWPLVTARSLAEASPHRLEKWRRTTIEAAKQSHQCWLPELLPPATLEAAAAGAGRFERAVFATFGAAKFELASRQSAILAFIGPEGGWTLQEEAVLKHAGVEPVSLGPNVLRIETAAIALASIVHHAGGSQGGLV